jgi:uncharacterized protein (DUF2147 family)
MSAMKKILFIILLFIANLLTAQTPDKIIGKWLTADKEAHIEIFYAAGKYYGKIVWLKQPINPKTGKAWLDDKNPDESKRNLPLMGSVLLKGFEKKGEEFINGSIYDSRDGKTYTGKIWIENNTLKLRGYWGMFYVTESWERVKSNL